jgi:hypothetical protein
MDVDEDDDITDGSSMRNACLTTYHITMAVFVRLVLLMHALLAILLLVSIKQDLRFWSVASLLVFLLIETGYCVTKRQGRESKW